MVRTDIAAGDVDRYRRDGFLVYEDLLDADELEVWRGEVDAAVARRHGEALPPGRRPPPAGESEAARAWRRYYDKVFAQRVNLWQTDARVADLVLDHRLGRLAAELAGVDGIRVWHDQALFKPPYGNPTALHLDVPFWGFSSPHAISVWIALDDANEKNGCLCYLPGSHRLTKYENAGIGPELAALFTPYPELASIEPVHCPVRAGSAVFHNGLVAHGAGANMTPHPRRAMTVQYMPDGCTFNGVQNILPDEYVATLAVGDVLDDETHNPLVYRAGAA